MSSQRRHRRLSESAASPSYEAMEEEEEEDEEETEDEQERGDGERIFQQGNSLFSSNTT